MGLWTDLKITDEPQVGETHQVEFLPHNREAEEAVLGAVFINPDMFAVLRGIISADDFYIQRHRFIWNAMVSVFDKQDPIDLITISTALGNQLDEVGGSPFLTALLNTVPNSYNAEAYAKAIKDASIHRRMIKAATAIAKYGYSDMDALDLVAVATDEIQQASSGIASGNIENAKDEESAAS